MRSGLFAAGFASLALLGCGNKTSNTDGPAPTDAPAPSASPSAFVSDAPPSPLSVVLEAKSPLVFSGLSGGVFVADSARTQLASASEGGELVATPMPQGLPAEGQILHFAGRAPSSVWVIFEEPKVGKDAPKNPFLRLERAKGSFKQYADDWKPHLVAWSKNRILAISTSSGKLKVKIVEPHQDKPTADMPSAKLDDEACAKSLRIDSIAALGSGEVFGAGSCKTTEGNRKSVVVRWAESSAAPTPTPLPKAEDAGPTADADAGADAGADAKEEPIGIAGEVLYVPDSVKPIAMVAQGPADMWLLAEAGANAAKLYRLESGKIQSQNLPKLNAPARGLAGASDGTLWLISDNAIWKRYPPGEWEEIPPPTRAYPEPDPHWQMQSIATSGADVYIAAQHRSSKAERNVLLRLRPAKETIHWN